jgi:hypothetical protein
MTDPAVVSRCQHHSAGLLIVRDIQALRERCFGPNWVSGKWGRADFAGWTAGARNICERYGLSLAEWHYFCESLADQVRQSTAGGIQ